MPEKTKQEIGIEFLEQWLKEPEELGSEFWKEFERLVAANNTASNLVCPYCNYDFYEDMPEISSETLIYMLRNKFPVPQSAGRIFEEAGIDTGCEARRTTIECFKCGGTFIAYKHTIYSTEKIEEEN